MPAKKKIFIKSQHKIKPKSSGVKKKVEKKDSPVEIIIDVPTEQKELVEVSIAPQDNKHDKAPASEPEIMQENDVVVSDSQDEKVEEKKSDEKENTVESLGLEESKDEEGVDNKEDIDEEGEDGGISFKKILLWIIAITVFLGALGALGFLVYQTGVRNGEESASQKIKAEATPTENLTPTPKQVSKDKYEIEVLNGSGISGQAGSVKSLLTAEGYKVTNTGNADVSDATDTVISTKKSVSSSWTDEIKNFLGKTYSVTTDTNLSDNDIYDVIITVGSSTAASNGGN